MFAEFSVENYKSFKERVTLSFVASTDKTLLGENTFRATPKVRLNKTSVLYGANASGKSNLFEALAFFLRFAVFSGPRGQHGDPTGVEVFVLDNYSNTKPSSFEFVIFTENDDGKPMRYRYTLELTSERVLSEGLYVVTNSREYELFYREGQKIETSPSLFKESRNVIKGSIRENASYLSVCAQFNGEHCGRVIEVLRKFVVLSGDVRLANSLVYTENMTPEQHERILRFLRFADLQIEDFKIQTPLFDYGHVAEDAPSGYYGRKSGGVLPRSAKEKRVYFAHPVYNENHERIGVKYIPDSEESAGTKQVFVLAQFLLEAFENGGVLFIDELDSSLHPKILEALIGLFNSPVENPRNAQLFFSCHLTNILRNSIFRRDQIWFSEKNQYGESDLYSLFDFKDPVRKDASYSKNYLSGKYGATPHVNEAILLNGTLFDWKEKDC